MFSELREHNAFFDRVPIGELRPWIGNPRKNTSPARPTGRSSGAIRAYRPARRLGLTHVPVRYLDPSPEDAQLLALADNKLGEIAEWDEGMLGRILAELKASNADLARGLRDGVQRWVARQRLPYGMLRADDLRPGNVFCQRDQLSLPENAPRGSYDVLLEFSGGRAAGRFAGTVLRLRIQ